MKLKGEDRNILFKENQFLLQLSEEYFASTQGTESVSNSDRPKAEFTEDRRFGRKSGQPNLRTLPKVIFGDSKTVLHVKATLTGLKAYRYFVSLGYFKVLCVAFQEHHSPLPTVVSEKKCWLFLLIAEDHALNL